MTAIWINEEHVDYSIKDGDVAFLIERVREAPGMPSTHVLRGRPAHTNSSHEPRLWGWCGTTDNVAVYAQGLAKIVRRAKNGRCLLARVTPTEALLEELGYPNLL
jgi:hypothetical protein